MKVVVVGSGAREHALAWKLLQSARVATLILAPGNEAALEQLQAEFAEKTIARWPESIGGVEGLKILASRSKSQGVEFAVVGPDNALADGAVDLFTAAGIPAFGPSKAASQIESSKIFSKRLMAAAGVPTAEFREADSVEAAREILRGLDWISKQWVVKADGLALGKGVEICETLEVALQALQRLQVYADHFVIEERLRGREISWLAFCDGDTCSLLPPAQDYKTLTEDLLSPNTGGMGSLCPVPLPEPLKAELQENLRSQVFLPVLKHMKSNGMPFKGILYAGLMIDQSRAKDPIRVLEFNARFGDPEAQVILPLLDADLLQWCAACVDGKLSSFPRAVPVNPGAAVYVCAAAEGYPGTPIKGTAIHGLPIWIQKHHGFFAGLKKSSSGQYQTDGGRVLGALGLGADLSEAREQAFERLKEIHFDGMQVRTGVGAEWV